MTKSEAIAALANGKKITHLYFTPDEWVQQTVEGRYRFEDANICSPAEFWAYRKGGAWENGWSIWESEKVQQKVQQSPIFDGTRIK